MRRIVGHYRGGVIDDGVLTVDEGRCRSRVGIKWTKYGPGVVPAWVADMDFDPPTPVLEALRGAAGHIESSLYRDVHEPSSYLITSEWDDEAAFGAFIKSDAFREVTNWGKEQILAGRPSHTVYQR